MPKCWICGADADSAEHMTKASDIRAIYPELNSKAPVYRQSRGRLNEIVQGPKSELLKFAPSLCADCNNRRSQPWDRAWEALERGAREAKPALRAGDRLPLSQIFPIHRDDSMVHVLQYFTKQIGCHAVEYDVPLPVKQFADCLVNQVAHQHLRLVFFHVPPGRSKAQIQVGDIHVWTGDQTGRAVAAVWHYLIGTLGVAVTYTRPEHTHMRMTEAVGWNPVDVNRTWRLHPLAGLLRVPPKGTRVAV